MTSNHLPGDVDLEAYGRPLFAEMPFNGFGFGLGFSVLKDAVGRRRRCRVGGRVCLGRGGQHRFLGRPGRGADGHVSFTQLLPSSTHPIRQHLRQLVYQALVA